jgi:hypothetical protein
MSTLDRFVIRHGRRIAVETLPSEAQPSKARQREADLFVKMPLKWSNAAIKALGPPRCFIPIWLQHLAWKNKSMTFTVSNASLAKYGISRGMKRRALPKLEAAGLIKIERQSGRAMVVTLLNV